MKGNKKIMQKIGKIIAIIYTLLFLLLIASSLYDAIKRDRFEGAIITIVIFSVPYFFYLWVKSFKASLRNYLERFARYDSKRLEVMSLSELQKRRKLYRLNKDVDHRETTREQLNIKIKEEVDFQKSQPTAIGQFMDGFKSTAGSSYSSKTGTKPNFSGDAYSAAEKIKQLEFEIQMYQEKYDEGMRSPNAVDHKYANEIHLPMIEERKRDLKHWREQLKFNQHIDSFHNKN